MADDMHPTTKLIADTIAAGFAISAYGFGVTARMFDVMSEAMSSATAPTTETKPAQEEIKGEPAKSATVLSFETAVKAKSAKPAKAAAIKSQDLKVISGIGPKLETLLNKIGIITLGQIAAWSADEAAKVDSDLRLNGRVLRDDWRGQAKQMAEG